MKGTIFFFTLMKTCLNLSKVSQKSRVGKPYSKSWFVTLRLRSPSSPGTETSYDVCASGPALLHGGLVQGRGARVGRVCEQHRPWLVGETPVRLLLASVGQDYSTSLSFHLSTVEVFVVRYPFLTPSWRVRRVGPVSTHVLTWPLRTGDTHIKSVGRGRVVEWSCPREVPPRETRGVRTGGLRSLVISHCEFLFSLLSNLLSKKKKKRYEFSCKNETRFFDILVLGTPFVVNIVTLQN